MPRHRAPRRIDDSARRVRVGDAISAARAALATSRQHEPDAPTEPLCLLPDVDLDYASPRGGRAGSRHAGIEPGGPGAVSRPPGGRQGLMRGAARSLLVTPWFAAGTGFVIAAGLWIYSPHTVLRFPASEPGVSICKSAGCVPDSARGGGSLTDSSPSVHVDGSGASRGNQPDVAADSAAAAGLTFKFNVLWAHHHGFGAVVTVSGHQVPSSWRLSFDIPGAQISYVTGVSWQASADGSGGTASAPQWPSDGGGDGGYGNLGDFGYGGNGDGANADGGGQFGNGGPGQGDTGDRAVISFLVTGSGTGHAPTDCVFDGASCTFR